MKNTGLYKDKVTVVTITYNAEDLLEETILSVINQNYENIEYIIIDGSSTDGTVDIIKKYEDKIDYWISEPDDGIYFAMNKAIGKASGEWINFMNAGDTFIDSITVQKVMDSIDKDTELIYGDHVCDDVISSVEDRQTITSSMPCCHQSLFVKTHLMKQNNFDTFYKISADYEFVLKMHKEGRSFKYITELISNYQGGGLSDQYVIQRELETMTLSMNNNFENGDKFYYLPKAIFKTQEESEDASTRKSDAYLASKIILNYQHMYTPQKVQKSISIVKEIESLPDYYFYTKDKIIEDEAEIFAQLERYFAENDLNGIQVISVSAAGKDIGLCPLDRLEKQDEVKDFTEKMGVDAILFYAPLRYTLDSLECARFAWGVATGMTEVGGTAFSYLIQTKEERNASSLLAYSYLENYIEELLSRAKQREEWLRYHKSESKHKDEQLKIKQKLIEEKDTIIKERGKLYDVLAQKEEELKKRQKIIEEKDVIIKERGKAV